jgi:hypothetical protein
VTRFVAPHSRRAFLAQLGLGGAAAMFPWLNAAHTRAQAKPSPKLLLFYTPHGTVWDQWRPTGGVSDFKLSPILEPLAMHREQLVIVDGISMVSGTEYYIPHTYTMPLLWTGSPIDTGMSKFCRDDHGGRCFGWNTGISVDQHIAAQLKLNQFYPTLELGYSCGGLHPASRMIYASVGTPKSPIDDPVRAFQTLFGKVDAGAQAAARAALRQKSVLDTVVKDLASRRARLSPEDKLRLSAHETAVRELERALGAGSVACTKPGMPAGVNSETAMDRQADIAAAALGCGITRIVSMQHRIADNDNSLYPWAGLSTGGHHSLSHDSGAGAQGTLAKVYRWYSARFAYLLNKLANTPDPEGGSVLSNTLVIWGSELGRGYDHDIKNVPFIFAGGAAGRLKGGRYLKVASPRHNRVLVTACHAMGLTQTEKYGSLDNASGPLPGLLT